MVFVSFPKVSLVFPWSSVGVLEFSDISLGFPGFSSGFLWFSLALRRLFLSFPMVSFKISCARNSIVVENCWICSKILALQFIFFRFLEVLEVSERPGRLGGRMFPNFRQKRSGDSRVKRL